MLKMAVVGAGWVTTNRHIPALRKCRRVEIVGVLDRNADRAAAAARQFDLPHFGTDLDASWLDGVTAASVGVSPASHFGVADALLARGKHVLLEKPMCLTVEQGERLARRAAGNQLTLAIVHNFQFSRSAMAARRALDSGRWGRLLGMQAWQLSNPRRRLPTWYEELPLGLFYDESPHLLYLMRSFGGRLDLQSARVTSSRTGKVTPAVVQAEFDAAGVPATLSMNFEAPLSEWQVLLLCERGAAAIDIFRDILVFVPNDARHGARDIARSSIAMLRGHALGFIRSGWSMVRGRLLYGNDEVVKRFVDAVEMGRPIEAIDAASALEILRLQHSILEQGTKHMEPAECVSCS